MPGSPSVKAAGTDGLLPTSLRAPDPNLAASCCEGGIQFDLCCVWFVAFATRSVKASTSDSSSSSSSSTSAQCNQSSAAGNAGRSVIGRRCRFPETISNKNLFALVATASSLKDLWVSFVHVKVGRLSIEAVCSLDTCEPAKPLLCRTGWMTEQPAGHNQSARM